MSYSKIGIVCILYYCHILSFTVVCIFIGSKRSMRILHNYTYLINRSAEVINHNNYYLYNYVELHCLTVSSTNYMLLLQLFTDAL